MASAMALMRRSRRSQRAVTSAMLRVARSRLWNVSAFLIAVRTWEAIQRLSAFSGCRCQVTKQ
jgi:hypothetical protein